jgi:hypothetical protein
MNVVEREVIVDGLDGELEHSDLRIILLTLLNELNLTLVRETYEKRDNVYTRFVLERTTEVVE